MATSQRKSKHVHILRDERGDVPSAAGNANVVAGRFEQSRAQFDFGTPTDRAAEYRRAIGVLGLVAIASIGAILAIAYFAGAFAAAIVVMALAGLVGFGNWVLNNTIDLM